MELNFYIFAGIGIWLLIISLITVWVFLYFRRLSKQVNRGNLVKVLDSVLAKERKNEASINKLRKEGFTGKFVAIKNSKPLTSGESIDIVIKEIEGKGENPSYVFIEFVHPEGYTLIL